MQIVSPPAGPSTGVRAPGGSGLALRAYQQEALAAILASPHQRPVLALACGLGKTVVFAHLIAEVAAHGQRCLVLVHTDELIEQTIEKLAVVAPGLSVGVVKAARDEHAAPIVVASVQTLARKNRRERLTRDFALVVVDECHHATAPSYRAVLEYLRCFDAAGPRTLGVTATPERGDGVGLDNVFEAVVYHKDIFSGIEDGFLCDLRGLQVHLAADLDRVRTRGGDFIEGELSRELERADIPAAMVQAYARHAPARKALAYLPSVHLAARTAALFREAGIAAAAVSGKTPLEERRQTLCDLRCGSLRIVANCAVLVEGYDDPAADCILLGRPTKSRLLYTQITGRGARQYPGKHDCLIVDFVGATTRHDLVTLGDLFGLPLRLLEGRTVTEAKAEQAREEQERAAAEQRRLAAREVELLRRPAPAPRRPLHWAREGTIYALPLPRGCLAIHPVPGGYRAVRLEGRDVVEELTATPLPIDWAQGVCEDWAREHDVQHLSAPDAAWRAEPASDKQWETLRRMGKPVPPDMTKGAASDLISVTGAAWTLGRRKRA